MEALSWNLYQILTGGGLDSSNISKLIHVMFIMRHLFSQI